MKVKKLIVLLLSIIIIIPLYANCVEGQIKFQYKGKEVINNESYCYDNSIKLLFSSKACSNKKICQNKNLGTLDLKLSEIAGETGSLGFKICENFQGTPQIVDYWGDNKWNPNSRCLFDDGSFIDNASLAQKVKYVD